MSNKDEFLKRYIVATANNIPSETIQKKRKTSSKTNNVVIVDHDIKVQNIVAQVKEEEDPEDKPLVVAVTEDIELKRKKAEEKGENRWVEVNAPKSQKDIDASPPRRQRVDEDTSPPRRRHDLSPPTSKQSNDISPPRRRNEDTSPPRRNNNDLSPVRKRRHDEDISPPRRKNDENPPRKRNNDSSPQRRKRTDESPPRRRNNNSSPPPRKHNDSSPPRRRRHDSTSPPRRKRTDESPPRRRRHDEELSPSRKHKQQQEVIDKRKTTEEEARSLGKGAATVFRDKATGKKIDPDALKSKMEESGLFKDAEEEGMEWGKGLVQKQAKEDLKEREEIEKFKPFARTEEDEDLNKMWMDKDRWGDPMMQMIKEKKPKKEKKQKKEKKEIKRIWKGAAPPNRFNILPGMSWDGVDRSNGYEKNLLLKFGEKIAKDEKSYLWSVEDM